MANNPTLLTRPLAEDGQKNTIPDTTDATSGLFSQQYGWQSINSLPLQAGGKAVKREDFNGAFNLLGGVVFMAQKGFTFNFDATQDYYIGCVVTDPTDGQKYECIADVSAGGSAPSADSAHWQLANNGTDIDAWFRQASTAYANGAIALLLTLPVGWYLECTGTGGITSASDLVITTPNVGNTVTDGTVVWTIRKIADTTDATTTTHGLMSAADKTKLNGVANNANNYSLPAATGSVRGGIKIGSNISLSGDTISLAKANVTNALGYTPPTTNTTYSTGTASYSGITKLYTGVGDNTDGTMTQKAIKAIVGTGGGIIAASLAANGYVKFANGYTMQWGKLFVSGSSWVNSVINFPIAFSNTPFSVIATVGGTWTDQIDCSVYDVNNTTAQIHWRSDTNHYVFWVAVGI